MFFPSHLLYETARSKEYQGIPLKIQNPNIVCKQVQSNSPNKTVEDASNPKIIVKNTQETTVQGTQDANMYSGLSEIIIDTRQESTVLEGNQNVDGSLPIGQEPTVDGTQDNPSAPLNMGADPDQSQDWSNFTQIVQDIKDRGFYIGKKHMPNTTSVKTSIIY